ncbi:MAG: tetratricopeptide repeat protein [Bdellovibrionia bacterium]
MKLSHRIVTGIIFFFSTATQLRAEERFSLKTFKTHSRLVVRVDPSVPVSLKTHAQGFEILLKGLTLLDFVPSAESHELSGSARESLQGLHDLRLQKLDLKEGDEGIRVLGRWSFPKGKQALATPQMETFEFWEKKPQAYVLDFWLKEGPTLREIEALNRKKTEVAQRKALSEVREKTKARRLATLKWENDFLNPMKACDIPMSDESDIFLKFNTIHQPVDFGQWFTYPTPDINFSYFRPTQKARDAQYVRLALNLYKEGKWGLVVRVLDFLGQEFPHSEYAKEMKFLRANAYIKLGLEGKSNELLRQIIADYDEKSQGSSVALYSAMYLAGKFMKNGNILPAIENLQWLVKNYSSFSESWIFHLGLAENYARLKQTEAAAQEYQLVIEQAPTPESKSQAAFRVGDLYLERHLYAEALASYAKNLSLIKGQVRPLPSFFLNRAEALYQLGQFDTATAVLKQYLNEFPAHPEGWRAMIRLGEMAAKNTLDPERIKESRLWFSQAINRFPLSPGALIARMRLIPCGDHAGMDFVTSEKFFRQEATEFDGEGEISLDHYNDLRALSHVRSVASLGTAEALSQIALEELKSVKQGFVRRKILLITSESIQREIIRLLREGKDFQALSFYSSTEELLNQDHEGEKIDYLLALAQSASNLGLGNLGQKLVQTYQKRRDSLKKKLGEQSPQIIFASTRDDLEAEIRQSEESFVSAKALWISAKKDVKNYPQIEALLKKLRPESSYEYEKEIILGLMAQEQGDYRQALVHAAHANLQKASPQVSSWLADLTWKAGDPEAALRLFEQLEKNIESKNGGGASDASVESTLGVPPTRSLSSVALAQCQILEQLNQLDEAALRYSQERKKGRGGSQMAYQYARLLMKSGDLKKKEEALEVLEKLSNEDSTEDQEGFWKKLAQETLAGEKVKKTLN